MEKGKLLELLSSLESFPELKITSNPILKNRGLDCGFEFTFSIESRVVPMIIGFSKHFPLVKPDYFLVPNNVLGHIPHVEKDGWVCYTNDDYLAIDSDNPQGIISESFLAVKKTLQDGILEINGADFLNEFGAYWNRQDTQVTAFFHIEPSTELKKIKVHPLKGMIFGADDTREAISALDRIFRTQKVPLTNAIYIPLQEGSKVLPPAYDHKYSLDEINALIFSNISEDNKKQLPKVLKNSAKPVEYVVLSQIQPDGNVSFFGFRFSKIQNGHPLLNSGSQCKIEPLSVTRVDKGYLLKRGGNGLSYEGTRGLIIGAGSVGGFISEHLVQAGILNLTIVDKEKLEPNNIYRHTCGCAYLGKYKTDALKEKIERHFPHANIVSVPKYIEDVLSDQQFVFDQFDFVIVATGNVTINMALNKLLLRQYPGLPAFYTWLDPYGIGGHCLVTNIQKEGCYHCLYSNQYIANAASFAAADQHRQFTKSISGCGNLYTPFSALDVIETSLLTTRTTLNTLNGQITENAVFSWKGDAKIFLAEGFKLSNRYNFSQDELDQNKHKFVSPGCHICKTQPL